CRPPVCHLYGTDRRDAKEPAARQLEWRVASEQEVTLSPVERIARAWSHTIERLWGEQLAMSVAGHSRPIDPVSIANSCPLLLLMLEAVHTNLVSPSARSAAPKIFSYPQAAGRLPHLRSESDRRPAVPRNGAKSQQRTLAKTQASYGLDCIAAGIYFA